MEKPDIRGTISRIIQDDKPGVDKMVSIEVEGIHVIITSDTKLVDIKDDSAGLNTAARLKVGQKVEVYSTGLMLQSFPSQVEAIKIVVVYD